MRVSDPTTLSFEIGICLAGGGWSFFSSCSTVRVVVKIRENFETQPSKAGSGCDSKSVEAYLDNELPAILLGIVFSFTFRLYAFEKILTLA